MHLFKSAVIDAPLSKIWPVLRRFDSVAEWSSGIASADMEGGDPCDRIGAIRKLVLPDGGVIRETLLTLDDRRNCFTYDIIESPLPIWYYVATQNFHPVTMGNQTYATWEVRFAVEDKDADAMAEVVGVGIFESGFKDMQDYFGR